MSEENMDTYNIEKRVPLPRAHKYPWKDMEPGDSFTIDITENERNKRNALYASARYHKIKIATRITPPVKT